MSSTTGVQQGDDFIRGTEPFRRELTAYCYRLVGSVHDAEDLVQETYLNAWRAYSGFEGRSSLRTWLYRIATRVCLKAMDRQGRRPLPSGLRAPSRDPTEPADPDQHDRIWLQPIPDTLFMPEPSDPASVVQARQSMRLALVAALQHLPPRQRVALVLRDVLGWRAAEAAELLGTSTAAVNSALQRARAQLADVAPAEGEIVEPDDPAVRALLDRYAAAFEDADMAALERLLTEDASWEMPPMPRWFRGRLAIVRFLAPRVARPGGVRMVATSANGQPAFALYAGEENGFYRAHAIHLPTISGGYIAGVVAFHDADLFPTFGLPTREDSPVMRRVQ